MQIAAKYKLGPIFTPPVVSKIEGPLATLVIGSGGGGTNWPGGSFDPETQILYVSSNKSLSQLGSRAAARSVEERSGLTCRATRRTAVRGPRGGRRQRRQPAPRLRLLQRRRRRRRRRRPDRPGPANHEAAVRAASARSISNKGEIIWQIAHGETPDNITNHPAAQGADDPAHRPARHRRPAGDKDAAHGRRSRLRPHAERPARRHAARLRQGERARKWARSTCPLRKAARR